MDDLIEASKQSTTATAAPAAEESKYEKVAEQAGLDDSMKIDMRVAKVLNCEAVEGSTELLKLDLGFGFEKRIIFSSIATSYPNPAELNGRIVIAATNFAPCKTAKLSVSEGMILSAATAKGKLKLLDVGVGAQPEDKVGQALTKPQGETMLNLSASVLKEIELFNDVGLPAGTIITVLRLEFPVEFHDWEDKQTEEAVLLMINPSRKAPSLSR